MDYSVNEKICKMLLEAQTAEEVEKIIQNEDFFKKCKWTPIGGKLNEGNAGRVEGQMKYPENAFVEKITNSIDAILMRRCREEGIDPTDKSRAPKSLREAIDRYIGDEKEFEKLRKTHSDIIITAEGTDQFPTLTVIDRGEGQEPNRLPGTILGLSNRLKVDIAFVYGKYHQGGTAALRFAGSKPTNCYQLVLSRRGLSLNPEDKNWGFALVRKIFFEGGRLASYQYCVDEEEKIFTIPASFENPFTKKNGIDFPDGTLIKIYDYQLSRPTSIAYGKKALAEDINKKLLQPAIPIHLKELRPIFAEGKTIKSTQYTIAGFLRIITKDSKDVIKEEFSIPADLGPLGKKNIRFIILKHVSDSKNAETYRERHEKIFYLENGLALNTQSVGFISNDCNLPDVADYILCFIDISDVSPQQTNLFHSSREEFANTTDYKELKDKLKIVFRDPKFIDLQREYKQKNVLGSHLLDKDMNKILENALRADAELIKDLDLGEDLQLIAEEEDPQYPEIPEEYEGQFLPTKFELIGKDIREIQEGGSVIVSFKTEAVDDFLDRTTDSGVCDAPASTHFSLVRRAPRKGVVSFRVEAKTGVLTGMEESLIFKLEVPTCGFSQSQKITFRVIPKTEYLGEEFPSFISPQKKNLEIIPEESKKIALKTDASDDLLVSKRATLDFVSNDLELIDTTMKHGLIQLTVKCISAELGRKDDIQINIKCTNGTQFPIVIGLDVVEDKKTEKFKRPELIPVETIEDWKARGWDVAGADIAEVVRDADGLTVYYNPKSTTWEAIKNKLRSADLPLAEKKYMADCYIQSLHLYFEFKDESDYKNYVRRSMKALGKTMPAQYLRLFRI